MKENNNRNEATRTLNKNTKTIALILAVAITITLGIGLSIRSTTMIAAQMSGGNKPIIMHFHPHLNLITNRYRFVIVERPLSRSIWDASNG